MTYLSEQRWQRVLALVLTLMMLLTGFLMLCAGLVVLRMYRRNRREGKET